MAENEHIKPLAPSSQQQTSDHDQDQETTPTPTKLKQIRKTRFIRCCSIVSLLLLLPIIIIIILIFTIFKVKDPIISMNGVTVNTLVNSTSLIPPPGSNMSITADVAVKNPNYASFKYQNTTTTLYYHGTVIGEARGPPGKAKARRTMDMNITVEITTDKVLEHPSFLGDFSDGLLVLNSFTRVGGRVKFLGVIKRHVVVKMNCTVSVNITSQAIHEQKCKRKVKL